MITGELQKLAAVVGPAAQGSQQPGTLIEGVPLEAHQQVVGLAVVALHLIQGLLGGGAEFAAEVELLSQFGQQRHRPFRGEVVEGQGHQPITAPATIGCQQVQLAAEAVAEAQAPDPLTAQLVAQGLVGLPEQAPGAVGLALMIEAGHVAPGMDAPAAVGQGLEQTAVAELGGGGQVAAADEFDQAQPPGGRVAIGIQNPEVPLLTPGHGQWA